MTTRTLFTISADLLALADLLTETDGDVTDPEALAAITLWFTELDADLGPRLDAYVWLIAELEGRAAVRKQEAGRLAARARIDTHAATRLKDCLYDFLTTQGHTKLTTPYHQLAIVRNGGLLPLRLEALPTVLPARFQKISVLYDTEALREALDAGEVIVGVEYGPRGDHLSIR